MLQQRRHRGPHLLLQGRISGKERVAPDDVLREVRVRGQLLHHGLGVGRVEHVLHQLRVLSHLLKQRLHARRPEEGSSAGRTLRLGLTGSRAASSSFKIWLEYQSKIGLEPKHSNLS